MSGVGGKQFRKGNRFSVRNMIWSCRRRHICQQLCVLMDGFNRVKGFLSALGFVTSCSRGWSLAPAYIPRGSERATQNQGVQLWPFVGQRPLSDWIWKSNPACLHVDHSAELSSGGYVYCFFLPDRNGLCHLVTVFRLQSPCICTAGPLPVRLASWVSVWMWKDMFPWNMLSCLHSSQILHLKLFSPIVDAKMSLNSLYSRCPINCLPGHGSSL